MKEVRIEENCSAYQDVDTNPSEVAYNKIKGIKVKEKVTYKSSKRPRSALEMATKKRKYKVKEKSSSKKLQEFGNNVVHSSMDSATIQGFVRELPPQQEFGIPIEDIYNRRNPKNMTQLLQTLDPNFYQGYDLMSSSSIAHQQRQ
ncbi:uncharacterized protein LOC113773037 [Coffea eugenioides]|nr:uncharacterized protein LOC113773037 [Coffea eugenioides]